MIVVDEDVAITDRGARIIDGDLGIGIERRGDVCIANADTCIIVESRSGDGESRLFASGGIVGGYL